MDDVEMGIVAQRGNERAQGLATRLGETLAGDGIDVHVDETTGAATPLEGVPIAELNDSDLLVSIGGDGTFLYVAREAGDAPILGVNLGEVGFLNAVAPGDALETVTDVVATLRAEGCLDVQAVDRLAATGDGWELEPALNEVVVQGSQRGHAGGVDLEVYVDGKPYAASRADGVLVSTPTGSTAYNLSEGGPLVRPTVDALVVTQMCAGDPMPPLVVDRDSEITVDVFGTDVAYAISDGRNERALEPPATVTVTLADDPIRLVGPSVDFFEALEKLE